MLSPFGAQKLILGGHTFLRELGNDPVASPEERVAVVGACLGGGIRVIDTTYSEERVGLREALAAVEAPGVRPILWNFFAHPEIDGVLPGPDSWTEPRFQMALDELAIAHAPFVVMHPVGDAVADRGQLDVLRRLRDEGRITHLGFWIDLATGVEHRESALRQWHRLLEVEDVWQFVVTPWNVNCHRANQEVVKVAKARGWTTLGTSPFVRGWELERRAACLAEIRGIPLKQAVGVVADALLRFSAFSPGVDHVVNAMRKHGHVASNLESIRRGPLSEPEREWILGLAARTVDQAEE